MGNKSSESEVRLERLRPKQIEKAIGEMPAIYVPCGSIEWHGRQNPVGLDALKAQQQLMLLAGRIGGLVYPPIFLGAGGGHLEFQHTFMVAADPMISVMTDLLTGFERDGFKTAVLLSGHYPNKMQYFEKATEIYRRQGGSMRVIGLVESEVEDVGGDHAALYETSYMMHLIPELVGLSELAGRDEDIGGLKERRNWMDPAHESHPCYGIVGIDPRRASANIGKVNTERLLSFLSDAVLGR